jgi:hypothetical protein
MSIQTDTVGRNVLIIAFIINLIMITADLTYGLMMNSAALFAASLNNEAAFIIKPYVRSAVIIIRFIIKAIINTLRPAVSVFMLILIIYLNLTLLIDQL